MKSQSINPIPNEQEAFEKLQAIGEEHLLNHWDHLDDAQRQNLRHQISQLDVIFFHRQQEELLHSQKQPIPIEPFSSFFPCGNRADIQRGKEALKKGKCGCIILAGGQGSRFRCKGPKGCVPISNVKKKSLFQLLAEKIKAASKQADILLRVAIMTSPLNHVETELYFVKNAFFGLDPSQITFFYQRMWPFLNFDGHLFLDGTDRIAQGPNGNGGVFRRFVEIGLWQKWDSEGIEMVNVIPIDNPLSLPFDNEIFGFQQRLQSEVVIKAANRCNSEEKVGLIVKAEGKTRIIDYFELTHKQKTNVMSPLANLGLYSFSMSFIGKVSHSLLPLHREKKVVKQRVESGKIVIPHKPNAWKFEEFIFDVLPLATACEILLYPRDLIFAPLKNLEGQDSIETVQAALLNSDQNVYTRLTGRAISSTRLFELSASFYYPTEALLNKWKGKALPDQEYIED